MKEKQSIASCKLLHETICGEMQGLRTDVQNLTRRIDFFLSGGRGPMP